MAGASVRGNQGSEVRSVGVQSQGILTYDIGAISYIKKYNTDCSDSGKSKSNIIIINNSSSSSNNNNNYS